MGLKLGTIQIKQKQLNGTRTVYMKQKQFRWDQNINSLDKTKKCEMGLEQEQFR